MGIRIFASCMVLTKASRYANLLVLMDLRICPSRLCTLLRLMLRNGPSVQMVLPALKA